MKCQPTTRALPRTFSGRWRRKLQRVSQHVVVVPHIQLVVSGVVVDGGDVLVRVGKRYLNGQLLPPAGVVGVDHHVAATSALGLPLIVLEDGAHGVEHPAGHEGIAGPALVEAGRPRSLKAQSVRVHLQTGQAVQSSKKIK